MTRSRTSFLLLLSSFFFSSLAAAAGTAGCGKSHPLSSIVTTYHGLTSSGRDRSYSVHLPGGYDKNKPYATVLGFHGSSTTGLLFELDTKMSESRFSGNKIMVYPNGVGGSWGGPTYAEVSADEDLQFISDLLDEIKREYCVEDSRIYATGISNGGGFVDTIACSPLGDAFAAFAPASGAFYTDNSPQSGCAPARTPLPILEIHGGSDEDVSYAGGPGEGGVTPAIADWVSFWVERNGCAPDAVDVEDTFDGDVHHSTWTECADGAVGVVQHWKIDDMGHCWADTEPNFSQLSVLQGPTHVQASKVVMEFFDQFAKP